MGWGQLGTNDQSVYSRRQRQHKTSWFLDPVNDAYSKKKAKMEGRTQRSFMSFKALSN